ncbi:MAG TPA: hypothetical protein PK073_07335 [Ignavibacteriaceae bacterium]|jgi:MFS family permease|nr:MAG: hypothetical protein BWY38_01172 [Ignavibacteria bacterium ADurb.Bin266]OQY74292.1 MAG: hypothetical protein B6D44_04885 [Ignavibacteriales bacterium UTCHB2]HQF42712.1 hypothetical protein [Ignavibacteriaceae bacterium]HQI40070.1 hypothetical protein [Ignavibacteriaceae bacterium]
MYTYTGLIFGDFISGFLSQILKSRKKVVSIFILLTAIFVMVYLFSQGFTTFQFYALCVILGISIGYWAVFITTAAEQFGTNLRSTVATTVPNFIRGSVIPITLSFELLRQSLGLIYAALIVGIIAIIIALISLYNLKDTYGVELDYVENI